MRAFSFIACLSLMVGMPNWTLAGYGLDEVPNSTFLHSNHWLHYGADSVPQTRKHLAGLPTTYGIDRVPGEIRLRHEDPHHVLMLETIEHLTGSVEVTPGVARAPRPRAATPTRRAIRPLRN